MEERTDWVRAPMMALTKCIISRSSRRRAGWAARSVIMPSQIRCNVRAGTSCNSSMIGAWGGGICFKMVALALTGIGAGRWRSGSASGAGRTCATVQASSYGKDQVLWPEDAVLDSGTRGRVDVWMRGCANA